MALLEASMASIPAIVTDVGGNPEVVIDGRTGWIVCSGDSEQLSGAIYDAFSSVNKRQSYAVASKERFETNFTFKNMIAEYAAVYSALV